MKLFLYLIYPLFFFAMGCGIYVAYNNAEGLVDKNYYENGKHYFAAKEVEQKLDVAISKPDSLKMGSNEIHISVTSHGKPLEDAALSLFVGNLSSTRYDSTLTMQEEAPGIYHTTAAIPFKGVWFVRIDLVKQQLRTTRKWFFDVR